MPICCFIAPRLASASAVERLVGPLFHIIARGEPIRLKLPGRFDLFRLRTRDHVRLGRCHPTQASSERVVYDVLHRRVHTGDDEAGRSEYQLALQVDQMFSVTRAGIAFLKASPRDSTLGVRWPASSLTRMVSS